MFPDRFNDDIILQFVELPPIVNTPTANYTTISELLSTPLSLSPATARSINPDYKPQHTYNYSMGVQRDLGWKLLADVAYVGSKGRRLLQTRNINAVPYGTNFLPSSIDPTTGGALPAAFLRPYRGYGDILLSEFAGFSDYDALQTAINRRYSRGLRFGLSYTLSKAKNVGGNDGNGQSDGQPVPRRPRAQLRRRRPAAQPDHQLRVRRAWAEQEMGHRCRARHLRQLADLGSHVGAERRDTAASRIRFPA